MPTMCADDVIFLPKIVANPNSHGFLTQVKMNKARHLPLTVHLTHGQFESSDQQHPFVEGQQVCFGQILGDRCSGRSGSSLCGFFRCPTLTH